MMLSGPPVDKAADFATSRASVLIVNFNSGPHLARCLDCLAKQTYSRFDIVLVDNASTDASMALAEAAIARLSAPIKVIRSTQNLGFAAGNNLAARHASGRWLALLNPDAFAEPEWLEQLVAACERAGAVMAGSLQLWEGHPGLLDGAGDAYHISGVAWRSLRGKPATLAPLTGETFSPCAAAALYAADVFRSVGGFDERFFAYHEDVDLAFRIRLLGGRALQVQEARISHVGSGAPGVASALAVRFGTRNRIWTFVKNMPGWLFLALLPIHAAAVLFSLVRDARRRQGRSALQGMAEALFRLGPVLADRRRIQSTRTATVFEIGKALTLSPFKPASGRSDVRSWTQAPQKGQFRKPASSQ